MVVSLGWVDAGACTPVFGCTPFVGGYLALRRESSADSTCSFLAERRLDRQFVFPGAWLFANLRAEHRVGLSGDACRYGLPAGAGDLTPAWALVVACLWFPIYIRNQIFATAELLETRFHPRARGFFFSLMLVISLFLAFAFTTKTDQRKWNRLTINRKGQVEASRKSSIDV